MIREVVTADYERTYGRDVLPDRAHDGLLDVAVTGGVPAALAYGALAAFAFLAAWRGLRARDSRRAGLGVAVIAYLAQQVFLFPLAELDPILWLAAGALLASEPSAEPRIRRLTGGVAAVAASVLFVAGALGVAADRAAADATDREAEPAIVASQRAVALRPDVVRYRLLEAAAERSAGTLAGVDAAIESTDRAVDLSPHDPIALRLAADARLERARITGTPADTAAALTAWTRLVADDPNCRPCQYGLGTAAALAGERALAERAWTAADDLSRSGDERAAEALAALRAGSAP